MADYDARLVELYDEDNPDGPDHDWFRALADEVGARAVLDLGCGTGILTVTLAGPGRTVVGVDPSPAMLAYAAARPGGGDVRWVLGDSRNLPAGPFDYAVMSGNVAQHIPDGAWERTLADVGRALRPGGVLAFESRNPRARAWDWWAGAPTLRQTGRGPLREWSEITEPAPGLVAATFHTLFVDTGEEVVEELCLAFRERALIEEQLTDAGFVVDDVRGGWDGAPCEPDSPMMIFRAHRAGR
ncbi:MULTISPECIES: trans-aconitate 2-methyltransferase [unclassified Actinotalea]|uniref:class I SAM-dependent methyltransferase n=1 Tax=unclassified Actinotalea TaxID=2638618 RepID=UPI0015F5C329|nr:MULTISPECIES: class I SAM-dependent methyltransferase [unclassified Actinotalea]